MAKTLYHSINLAQNELQNARLHVLGTAPATPLGGQIYYNSTDGNVYVYDAISTVWRDITVQENPPLDAAVGVKGITTLSSAPLVANTPIAVGDNDIRVTADQAAGTASIRTLGLGPLQAAAGNHTHGQLHTQNTDTGTSNTSFYLAGTTAADLLVKKSAAGEFSFRLGNDSGYAAVNTGALTVNGNLTVTGTTTTVNSNTLSVGDNIIELNNDVTTTAGSTEDAGLTVRRYTGADVRQDAQTLWLEAEDRWAHVFPASSGTGSVSKLSAVKHVQLIAAIPGIGVEVTHGLNTRAVTYSIREVGTQAFVDAEVTSTSVDSITITFGVGAVTTAGAYEVTVIG